MPNFRTVLPIVDYPFSITHQDHILCIGSCFAEHIGNRLDEAKFGGMLNPFGILYNPVSIGEGIEMLLSGKVFAEKEIFLHQEGWHSFSHHGAFSHPDKAGALGLINEGLEKGRQCLARASRLILTLGTANVFVYKETGRIVANCHKLPGNLFERRCLSVEEVADALVPVLKQIKAGREDFRVILTVSPVRHIRDGLVENQRSKATLLLAVDQLCRELDFTHYFPSYELLLDDLRDYRFYEADMIHPNRQAIDYIWDYFAQAFFPQATRQLVEKIDQITTAARHRPFHPETESHRQFINNQLAKIEALEREYQFLDFEKEKTVFKEQLKA
jgi:hypothetical protein